MIDEVTSLKFVVKVFDELTTTELYEILKARAEIFIVEQHINCQDMDDMDYKSLHCFLWEENRVAAYLRAYFPDDSIEKVRAGRVLTSQHGRGLGKKLLEESIPVIKNKLKCKTICIDAQTHAIGFYEKFGFKVTSEEFWEEGILHVAMELDVEQYRKNTVEMQHE